MKQIIITLSKSTFFWNILNGTTSLIMTELSGLGLEYTPVILATFSYITKELNKRYNPYYNKS